MVPRMSTGVIPLNRLLGVAGIPQTKQAAAEWAKRNGVQVCETRVRGGHAKAVHFDALPESVQVAHLQRSHPVAVEDGACNALWSEFVRKSTKVQARAKRAFGAVLAIKERLEEGSALPVAIQEVSDQSGYSVSALYEFWKKVKSAPQGNWLPLLAPNYKGGGRPADPWEDGWQFFLSYLKHAAPQAPLTAAYREAEREAKEKGWAWPSYGTVLNRWKRLPARERELIRKGTAALDETYPAQTRTVAHLQAMQIVNLDGRKADFFVHWEDGTVSRPIVIALQDVYSRLILGHLFSKTEDADTTKALLLDVIDRYGLFDELLTDNSRAFASKKISGGAGRSFRGKQTDNTEASGLLASCGVRVRFAKPRRGQSKPIERGFRDVARIIDTRPEFKGAYCGNSPDAKPEDFNGTAVDIAEARAIYAREVEHHNNQPGRRTETAAGKLSFQDVFGASFADRPERKLTEAQRHLFMSDVVYLKPNKKDGTLKKDGFVYWSLEHQDVLMRHANTKVAVYFDPNSRSKPVTVVDAEGRMLVESLPCLECGRFDSTEDARTHERAKAKHNRAVKQQVAAMGLMTQAELAAAARETRAAQAPDPPAPNTTVSQPLFGTGPRAMSSDRDDGARVLHLTTKKKGMTAEQENNMRANLEKLKDWRDDHPEAERA